MTLPQGADNSDGEDYEHEPQSSSRAGQISSPLLPEGFVSAMCTDPMTGKSNQRSIVFTPAGHDMRIKFRSFRYDDKISPGQRFVGEPGSLEYKHGFTEEGARTLMHYGTMHGDVLFVCELIYCGANPNPLDSQGLSPLGLGLLALARIQQPKLLPQFNILPHPTPANPSAPANIEYAARVKNVVRVLIEQLVNTDQVLGDDETDLFELACYSKQADIIQLLLRYGASGPVCFRDPPAFMARHFGTREDKDVWDGIHKRLFKETSAAYEEHQNRLAGKVAPTSPPSSKLTTETIAPSTLYSPYFPDLFAKDLHHPLSKIAPRSPRDRIPPPKKCPCFGGDTIDQCHMPAIRQYPPDYVCCCGSGRKYKTCCKKKGSTISERYLPPPMDRIIFFYGAASEAAVKKVNWMTSQPGYKILMQPRDEEGFDAVAVGQVLDGMKKYGVIDPAFRWGALRMLPPMPSNRNSGIRAWSQEQQRKWNKLIDEYMLIGGDVRTNDVIERNAKIDTWGGVYLRKCDGPGCKKYEQKWREFKFCNACKIAAYCSVPCQRGAWKTHKVPCKNGKMFPQVLPSQETVRQYLIHEVGTMRNIR